MALFAVPGWSVPAAPVPEAGPSQGNRKRRRSMQTPGDVTMDNISIPKAPTGGSHKNRRPTKKRKREAENRLEGSVKPKASSSESPAPPQTGPNPHRKERNKKAKRPASPTPQAPKEEVNQTPESEGLTPLQAQMKAKLHGARFRMINEQLYKSDSQTAHELMREDPEVFREYHVGFRQQVLSWPKNPVDHYISKFSSYPKRSLIADLGCGDAALARALVPKGLSVVSFDLVSDSAYVIEADICAKIPLPGSAPAPPSGASYGEGQVVDVVVCALSLMGVNWLGCIREAWRILKARGELHIAEVTSRFEDVEKFQSLIERTGFVLKSKDASNSHFTMFEFVKESKGPVNRNEWAALLKEGTVLKPCEYKRR